MPIEWHFDWPRLNWWRLAGPQGPKSELNQPWLTKLNHLSSLGLLSLDLSAPSVNVATSLHFHQPLDHPCADRWRQRQPSAPSPTLAPPHWRQCQYGATPPHLHQPLRRPINAGASPALPLPHLHLLLRRPLTLEPAWRQPCRTFIYPYAAPLTLEPAQHKTLSHLHLNLLSPANAETSPSSPLPQL